MIEGRTSSLLKDNDRNILRAGLTPGCPLHPRRPLVSDQLETVRKSKLGDLLLKVTLTLIAFSDCRAF